MIEDMTEIKRQYQDIFFLNLPKKAYIIINLLFLSWIVHLQFYDMRNLTVD